jgi:sialidase-1
MTHPKINKIRSVIVSVSLSVIAACGSQEARAFTMEVGGEELGPIQQSVATIHTYSVFNGNSANGGPTWYHSYRIPSIVKVANGHLLAFAEGRRLARFDTGDIDIVMRRSTDNGLTWGNQVTIHDHAANTIGNPTTLFDPATGRIWLFMSANHGAQDHTECTFNGCRVVYMSSSSDNGYTWTTKTRMSNLLPSHFTRDFMGPGVGVKAGNRLIIPGKGRNIYSDDGGASWYYYLINNDANETNSETDESSIITTPTGLRRLDRPTDRVVVKDRTQTSVSNNNGATWTPWERSWELLDPRCQSSVVQLNTTWPPRTAFLNAESTAERKPMVVKISYDYGATFPVAKNVDNDHGGYSSMAKTDDNYIAALREEYAGGYYTIKLKKFNLEFMVQGTVEAVEDFDNGALNPAWTKAVSGHATVTETGGRLQMANGNMFAGASDATLSSPLFSHINKNSFVEIVQRASGTNTRTKFGLRTDPDNFLLVIIFGDGTYKIEKGEHGVVTTVKSGTFNATTMRWLRIKQKGSQAYVQHGSNALGWSTFQGASFTTPAFFNSTKVYFGHTATVASPTTTSLFDHLNTTL